MSIPAADRRTHSPAELAALEAATGLELYGYLHAPPVLLPILGAPGRTVEQRRALVLRLARAGLPVAADFPQVEAAGDVGDETPVEPLARPRRGVERRAAG